MKITIQIDEDLKKTLATAVDDWDENDLNVLDTAKENLPKNAVKLPKDENMKEPGENAKPVLHLVKKGETLKSISERYGVSYGELSQHMMNTEGNTSIHEGMEIEIPRHFIDLTEAK